MADSPLPRRFSRRLTSSQQSSPSLAAAAAAAAIGVPSDASPLVTPGRSTRSKRQAEVLPDEAPLSESGQAGGGSAKSASTVPTPTRYASDDELSTPPTSNDDAPSLAESSSAAASKGRPGRPVRQTRKTRSSFPGFQPASSLLRLEIELPDRPASGTAGVAGAASTASTALAADSAQALRKSVFSLSAKRKRDIVEDSDADDDGVDDVVEVDDDDDNLGLDSEYAKAADAILARALQNREDRKHRGIPPQPPLMLPSQPAAADSTAEPILISDDSDASGRLSSVPASGLSTDSVYDDTEGLHDGDGADPVDGTGTMERIGSRRQYRAYRSKKRAKNDRERLEDRHPVLKTMWKNLEATAILNAGRADQPASISRNLKPFQLEGLAWMLAMEQTSYRGGLLGDEMGLGKTIQAVSLIMSDYPAKKPSLVLVPPVALMQWTSEIAAYTDGRLKTFIYHGTNAKTKGMTVKDVKQYDVILMSYNSLESMFRKQEKGFYRKEGMYKEKSIIHSTNFHRVILDEAHCIKTRSTMTAKACFALSADYRWCLTGTPLQNRIGEFLSLLRFLQVEPFANYICRECKCSKLEWSVDDNNACLHCRHRGMRHVSVFNQELLNPIQRYGNVGPGKDAFQKLRILTDRIMLRRLKKDHTDSMELPVKEIVVDRQFFSEVETDFANSIMKNTRRKFTTYVENGVMLNNYANIFGLIMQMRQVADHPDLILRKNSEGSQNVLFCCICDEPAEEAIRSKCKHDFCRECATSYLHATDQPDCPRCHIPLSIDLEQPEMEQDEVQVKKSSIINRIRMENWTSSSKIELLVHNLYRLRSDKASHKSIIFSQFTTMLQLIEWRLRRAGITTVMLDGSMTPAQRQASIEYFKTNVDVECFLVSLKAGGVALNLVEASRVFIVDPWWNPAAEWQSADRCHRIGQTRPCIVTRLCIEDSVESRMVLLQEKKTRMINSTINADDTAMESLTPEDLQFLFRGN